MARTIAQDYEKKRSIILFKAADAFAMLGYHKTSLDYIAHNCKMSKSLIYHYFSSKNEILFNLMESYVKRLAGEVKFVQKQALPPEQALHEIVRRFLLIYDESRAYHIVLLNELKNLPPQKHNKVVKQHDYIIHTLGQLISKINPKITHNKNLDIILTMILFGAINWTYTWFKPDGPISTEQFSDIVYNVFVNGINSLE